MSVYMWWVWLGGVIRVGLDLLSDLKLDAKTSTPLCRRRKLPQADDYFLNTIFVDAPVFLAKPSQLTD